MHRFLIIALAISAAWAKPSRLFEGELTLELQSLLSSFDPHTIPTITDIHVVTDHSDFHASATDLVVSGFSGIEVEHLDLAIPGVSHKVQVAIAFPKLDARTNDYSVHGTHDGVEMTGSGAAHLTFHGVSASVHLETDSISFTPLSICVKAGTLAFHLENTSIEGHLDGLDEINAHLDVELAELIAGVVADLNAQAPSYETTINTVLCHM
ncbi:uncharacterized protein LOC143032400 [Oratosquilla oratoria]|uniref:uncharacterized protein LOC143032400 n=1 Tax=Oratosquilla oratoria TaxID=337810 RepID=UPI003F766665